MSLKKGLETKFMVMIVAGFILFALLMTFLVLLRESSFDILNKIISEVEDAISRVFSFLGGK